MSKKSERATDYNDLPLILDVSHIQQIMGISKVSAYELVHMKVNIYRHTIIFNQSFAGKVTARRTGG